MNFIVSSIVASIVCLTLIIWRYIPEIPDDLPGLRPAMITVWILAFALAALPPFIASRMIAKRLNVSSMYFDVGWSALFAVLVGPSVLAVFATGCGVICDQTMTAAETDLHGGFRTTGMAFLIAGAVGGFVYRLISTKRLIK